MIDERMIIIHLKHKDNHDMSKDKGGRPEVHGLKVLTPYRVRRARLELCLGMTRTEVAPKVFGISPKTMNRYMEREATRGYVLADAIELGESLRGEPIGLFICYLYDKVDELLAARFSSEAIDDAARDSVIRDLESYDELTSAAYHMNNTIRAHARARCRERSPHPVEGLGLAQDFLASSWRGLNE